MGGSGSGKTTLLNVLAGRVDKSQMSISGDMLFSAQHPKVFRKRGEVGYLQQEDKLVPAITVRETLDFAAKLRLPASTTKQERQKDVESLIATLGLKDCADVRIGDSDASESGSGGSRGISGGERRRVSAAIQLLTRPSLLLCDEITSGLDSFTAFELVKTLNTYAKTSNKTVILSIHQPRSEIYNLLSESDGQLVLLSHGRVVYSGPLNQALAWFDSMGVEPCPVDMNPLDYIMDNSVFPKHDNSQDGATLNRIDSFATEKFMPETQQEQEQGGRDKHSSHANTLRGVSLWTQVATLIQRHWIDTRRNTVYIWGTLALYVVFAIMVGAVFWGLDGDINGIRGRASVIYVIGAFQPYMVSILGVYKGVVDMKVYDRERKERLYSPAALIISYSICQIPVNILATLGKYCLLCHCLVSEELPHLFTIFIICGYALVNSVIVYYISAMVMLSIALERDFDRAALVSGSLFLCSSMTSGFIIPTNQIPRGIRWIEYLSYHRIAYQTWISLEFTDRRFDCPFHLSPPTGLITSTSSNHGSLNLWDPVRCVPWEGNTILVDQLQGKLHAYPNQLIYFAAQYFGYILIAWLVLTYSPKKDALVSSRKSPFENMLLPLTRLFVSKGAKRSRGKSTNVPVTIRAENLSLSLVEKSLFDRVGFGSSERTRKTLLDNIDIAIPPAKLTAILGGSGSGKVTFAQQLICFSLWIRQLIASGMHITGDIYFNGTKNPSMGQINTVSGYVRQGDGMLMTHLTVRETLNYAAELGMGKTMSLAQKHARVEEILELMGLQECAEVMIGNSEKSGCSGGQRRRISIGMQLINEPTCVFLDEPTSGLDALTALSVIQTLKKITVSGRTVVCTIHQPRVDIWDEFDDVLLLVNGGRLAYAGRANQVMDHFERAGYPLPPYTNPPDFIIDTVSVNFRSHEQEADSRANIDALVRLYQQERTKACYQQLVSTPQHQNYHLQELLVFGAENTLGTYIPHHAGFISATSILTRRMFKNTVRQRGAYLNRIMEPFLITFIVSLFYWGLEDSPAGLLNRLGLFRQLFGGALAGLIIHTEVFPKERDIAFREMSNGSYGATSFLVSYMFNELPLTLLSSCLATLGIMTITGLRATVTSVLVMILVVFSFVTTGESLGIAYSCYLIIWMSFLAGFLIVKLPYILHIFNYLSIFRYAAIALSLEEFRSLQVHDSVNDQSSILALVFPSGDAVLSYLHMDDQDLGFSLCMVVVLMVMYRLMAWAALTFRIRSLLA
ncbi:MAG: P-loop containing nucleoside triphosphate hydrolase protein [Linnemannia gamsii]|nr:MAG: P-loop containing nucleoside triphosphate hydrolase protein [Linnemannia gamsii]